MTTTSGSWDEWAEKTAREHGSPAETVGVLVAAIRDVLGTLGVVGYDIHNPEPDEQDEPDRELTKLRWATHLVEEKLSKALDDVGESLESN